MKTKQKFSNPWVVCILKHTGVMRQISGLTSLPSTLKSKKVHESEIFVRQDIQFFSVVSKDLQICKITRFLKSLQFSMHPGLLNFSIDTRETMFLLKIFPASWEIRYVHPDNFSISQRRFPSFRGPYFRILTRAPPEILVLLRNSIVDNP